MPRKTSAPLNVSPYSDLVKKPVAAAFLGITPRSLENWRNRGLIPYVRVANRIIRYSLTDIAAALRKNGLVEAIQKEGK
jgi:predicted site-specific integrase-resolvase